MKHDFFSGLSSMSDFEGERRLRMLAWPREVALDPYYKLLYDGLEARGWKADHFTYWRAISSTYAIVHIHQGTIPFRNKRTLIALPRLILTVVSLLVARLRGARIVWSLHNLSSHEQYHPRMERWYLGWLSRQVSLSVHMSDTGWRSAVQKYPAFAVRPSVQIPLMHFGATFPTLVSYEEARKRLGLDIRARMVLFLGQIRRYKNVPELIRVFRELTDQNVHLFIVGRPHEQALIDEIEALATDRRITLSLRAATDAEVGTYMGAASLVVAPFQEILNSGTALLSLTHLRPVLLPNRGAMAELQSTVGPDWVRLYEPPLSRTELELALEWAASVGAHAQPDLSRHAPDRIVAMHAAAFLGLLTPYPKAGAQRAATH